MKNKLSSRTPRTLGSKNIHESLLNNLDRNTGGAMSHRTIETEIEEA